MNAVEAVTQARALLRDVTPLRRDCGAVCGAACCAPDEDGQGGMLLFPGEEALYGADCGFALAEDDSVMAHLTLLTCEGACERAFRPLACRMFPLIPVLTEQDGQETLRVMVDPRAFSVCPLCESGIRGMRQDFVDAVRKSALVLCQCEEQRAYLRALGAYFARLRSW